MENEISEFQYFVSLFWPFFTGALACRMLAGFLGEKMYWVSKAFGLGE